MLFWFSVIAGVLAAYSALAIALMMASDRRGWEKPLHCRNPESCPYTGSDYLHHPVVETHLGWRMLQRATPFVTAPILILGFCVVMPLVMRRYAARTQ